MSDASIGVCAYNEGENIGKLLDALLKQKPGKFGIKEICVISSGSTDDTEKVVREYERKDSRIKLLTQKKRMGKSSAVNLFLRHARGEIIVLESADTIPEEDTIRKLLEPFADDSVGMTGGRPVPVNDRKSCMGSIAHLVWELHHRMSVVRPKAGELVAFRNIIESIAGDTAVDEAWVESLIYGHGLRLVYVPGAVVYNRGPETVRDFVRQRKRIYLGHLHLKNKKNYSPLTMDSIEVARTLFNTIEFKPRQLVWVFLGVLLEAYSRFAAVIEFYFLGRNPFEWDIAGSTKKVVK